MKTFTTKCTKQIHTKLHSENLVELSENFVFLVVKNKN